MDLIFKICDVTDLETLVELSRTTFIDAYEKDNNPEDFTAYLDTAFSASQLKSELLDPNTTFCFLYKDNTLVGYFKLCENEAQTEPYGNATLELSRIYVLQPFQGQQLGKRMLQEIISMARTQLKNKLWLSVWEINRDAIRFYERHGFTKFDTHSFYVGKDKQTDWLMALDLV